MPIFTSDGIDLRYIDEGEGDPILLVHGFASNIEVNWGGTGWVKTLVDDGRRVIAFDHRGHGQSAKLYDPEQYTLHHMADDAQALLDRLSLPRVDLIGYSMGARVSALFAILHPERVRSLVIGGMGARLLTMSSNWEAIAKALEAPSADAVPDAYARDFRVFADRTKGDLRALAACMRASRTALGPDLLAQIACPTLVAVGTEDVVAGSPYDLAKHISGAEVLSIPGRDHNRAVGDPRFKDGVLAFLAGRA